MINQEKVIEHMIEYIIEEEKRLINQKYSVKGSKKTMTVSNIIIELEKVMKDEGK